MKSERLKKLEVELQDLEQWLKLGLVPKKDLQKHTDEMHMLRQKIDEEKERLRFLKESGEMEEFAIPKRAPHSRQTFQDPHSIGDGEVVEEGMTDVGLDMESESYDFETTTAEQGEEHDEETTTAIEDDDDDPFSDRNRWRRGILEDPDVRDW